MTTGATQQGAPAASTTPAAIDLNDANTRVDRNAAMAIIAARRREAVLADMSPTDAAALAATPIPSGGGSSAAVDDEDTDEGDRIAEAARAALAAQAAAAAAPPDTDVDTSAGAQLAAQRGAPVVLAGDELSRYMVTRKVNGVETTVPVEEVLRDAQKVNAADAYLAQAKQTLGEINTVAAQARAAAQQVAPAAGAATPAANVNAAPDQTGGGPDPLDVALNALFQGDEARAKQALRQAIGQTSRAGDPNVDVAAQVEQRIVIRSALRQFAKDHKAIVSDPTLRAKADEFLNAETQGRALTELDPDEIPDVLDAAGRRTMEWLRAVAGVPVTNPTPQADPLRERRERKQAIDELPAASARIGSTTPAPQTTSSVIESMRAARGQIAGQGPAR